MRKSLTIALLILGALPVKAAQCPYGQILRVHLGECVSWHSKLAQAYVKFPLRISHRKEYIHDVAFPPLPPSPPLKWSTGSDFPKISIPYNIVCVKKDDEREYGLCLLRIQLDELFSDRTNK